MAKQKHLNPFWQAYRKAPPSHQYCFSYMLSACWKQETTILRLTFPTSTTTVPYKHLFLRKEPHSFLQKDWLLECKEGTYSISPMNSLNLALYIFSQNGANKNLKTQT